MKKSVFFGLGLLSVPFAYAGFLPDPIENAFLAFSNLLPTGLRSESGLAIAIFKFLIWILVFAVMFEAVKKVFHDNKKTATIVALIMSLLGVVLIPNAILAGIFALYSGLISIFIIILPVFLVWYFNREVFGKSMNGWVKGIIYVGFAALILILAVWLENATAGFGIYYDLARFMEIAATVLLFIGMITFFEKY